ncbi:hypothetical protein GCM10008995_10390 [Halobellus salinus]|uniref:DUF1611 domain-containing protein n=1 Tax=Halobellus salinus TaxID=931585 RepID=A0A830EEK5_9EURY|nr:DUF1611 domain-containing protein [Halobellus salinus]GGJ02548.1 hypothetical protein GCM10008995_10390 [Halobellus salinus]SMP16905.1 Uncharacterized conserved protein, NAD-dependent epimerase/dehydratase family [Halobellus salinus]
MPDTPATHSDRVVVLAHGQFPGRAKTAVGVLKYSDSDVVAVLDRERAGTAAADHRSDLPDVPIVASMDNAPAADTLLIGIAPIGGGFDESWRPDVRTAIERGCDVVAGLHYFLAADDEFAALAAEHGVSLRDVRRPDPDIGVAGGRSATVDADVVLTVGTDCSVGKMTVALELVDAARERGVDAGFVPTGQTGIVIAGWGTPVDRVVSDFTAGAVEAMISEASDDHDVLFVEGQGSIVHPAYSAVTCGILHGAMPDAMVLCHEAGREVVHGYESFDLPPVPEYVDRYEQLAAPVHDSEVVAGAVNTSGIDADGEARAAADDYADAIGAPATDPIRFGADAILDPILGGR